MRMDMDQLMVFFQSGLAEDFGHSGNKIIESLITCAEELRKVQQDCCGVVVPWRGVVLWCRGVGGGVVLCCYGFV